MSAVRIALAALLLLLGANRAVAELMSADDHQAYQAAFAEARDWSAMKRSAAAATERAPAKILLRLELTRGNMARFADIADFIDHDPEWPAQDVLRHRAEEAMEDVPDAVLQPYFQKHRPVTTMGKLRLADIFTAAGQAESARSLVRDLWLTGNLKATEEDTILGRYAGDWLCQVDEFFLSRAPVGRQTPSGKSTPYRRTRPADMSSRTPSACST
jgi:soluble lytic murein transglycosylase